MGFFFLAPHTKILTEVFFPTRRRLMIIHPVTKNTPRGILFQHSLMAAGANFTIRSKYVRRNIMYSTVSCSRTMTSARRTTALSILVLGICLLAEVDKCIGATSAASFDTNTTTTSRTHNGRILESVDTSVGEFPFFAQWGGCGATLIWDDILLTSASVSD